MRAAFTTAFTLATALALSSPAAALECPAANCAGLQNPTLIKGPVGTYHPRYDWSPNASNLTLDLRQATFLANESKTGDERQPLAVFNGKHTGLYAVGGRVIGQQSRELTWRVVKSQWDGNGLLLRGSGVSTVEGMYIDNLHDAISPIEDVTKWVVKDVYAKYTRDDFVENDRLQPGLIEDTLVDGTFTFVSNRPGDAGGGYSCNGQPSDPNLAVEIRKTLVWMQRQPYDGDMKGTPSKDPIKDGRGGGAIFKWSECGGRVIMSDSIILIESIVATGGKAAMTFPPGKYTNVTVVWRGAGNYPVALPAGVKMTRDLAVWTNARKAWLAAHRM
jgi:hypothetical protein